jgi:hypothetical protein
MRRCPRAVRWAMASSAAPRLSITTLSTSSPKADRSAHPTRVPVVMALRRKPWLPLTGIRISPSTRRAMDAEIGEEAETRYGTRAIREGGPPDAWRLPVLKQLTVCPVRRPGRSECTRAAVRLYALRASTRLGAGLPALPGKEDRLVDGDAGKSPARGGSHRYVSNLLTTLSNRVSIPNSSQHYRTSATAAVLTWHSVMPVRIHACRRSLEHEGDGPLSRPRSRSTEPLAPALPAEAARSGPAIARLLINYPAG